MSESSKRRGWHGANQEEEPITDDLTIAAAYAMGQAPQTNNQTETDANEDDDEDSNEIDLEPAIDEDDQKLPASEEPTDTTIEASKSHSIHQPKKAQSRDNNDDDDDESDVDLTEALQQMDADENDVDGMEKQGDGQIPKTQNEIDPYQAQIQQLEAIIGTSLSVEEREQLKLKTKQVNLLPAGTIQHHMIDDRIIVVQSNSGLLLEEGNILVLKQNNERWIPLGKVFEVFGPVSQPMYSIRLPPNQQDQVDTDGGVPTSVSADPWSKNGEYTKLLQGTRQSAFYIKDDAIFIDTQRVYMSSGRGCDASNVHDEEVNNPNEMYYSDDEKERQAKGKGGKGKNSRNNKGQGRSSQPNRVIPQNFQQPYAPAGLPQGFHSSRPGGLQLASQPFRPAYPQAQPRTNGNVNSNSVPEESDTIYYD